MVILTNSPFCLILGILIIDNLVLGPYILQARLNSIKMDGAPPHLELLINTGHPVYHVIVA